MAYLMPLIQQLLVSIMAGSRSSPRFIMAEIVLIAISVILACVGFVFGLYAENLWLETKYVPEVAALATGGTAIVFAFASLMIGKAIGAKKKSQYVETAPDITGTITQIIDALSQELEQPIRENPKTAVALASLAGFVAGDHHLRQ